jgi:allophanate hydrolase subunit 1
MRSGIFAEVSNRPDVANEIALIFATHPHLDPLADRRLVEALALALVQQRRAIVAMQTEGMTSILTSYESRLAALSERLERAVHERDQQRAAAKGKAGAVDLSRYGQPASEPKT